MSQNLQEHQEMHKSDFLENVLENTRAQDAIEKDFMKFQEQKDKEHTEAMLDKIRELELPTIGE